MKNDLEHLSSPFLDEWVVEGEAPRSWDPDQAEAPPSHDGFSREDGDDELAFEALAPDEGEFEQHECGHCRAGCAHDREAFADEEEDEAPSCAGDHEFSDLEAELFDREAWSGSSEQIAFRDRVLAAHLKRSNASRGAPQRDLDAQERATVPGTSVEMRSDAAAAAGRLLVAANADLATAKQAGDADALRTVRLGATSGYRERAHQNRLWLQYFPGYYKRTRGAREKLAAGPHSEEAVAYMLRAKRDGGFGLGGRIAAPGYSNHQNGIAIDLWQERTRGHGVPNQSDDSSRAKWRASWFHGWLKQHAAAHGFQPLATEEWHWEFRNAGSGARPTSTTTAPSTSPSTPAPAAGKPGFELARFAQRVLKATEGEPLSDDGDFGPRSRAALERFRRKHGLGSGSTLDAQTTLALAQRALEELAQASMFARTGHGDSRTDAELIRFKTARKLPADAGLDTPTLRALGEAVAARKGAPSTPATPRAPAVPVPAPTAPGGAPVAHLGGQVWTFRARAISTPVAVFVPPAAAGRREVDVLLFAHGLLNGCPRPRSVPDGLITSSPFRLGAVVAGANRPVVLVLPLLDWNHPGGQAFGNAHPKWHALALPANLNALVAQALEEVGRVQSAAAPSLGQLLVAGHSRAYDFLEPLADRHTDPQMQQGALARLSEVWALDTTYSGNPARWKAWLAADPRLRVHFYFRPKGGTLATGTRFEGIAGGRLSVARAGEEHCDVPGKRLPVLLAQYGTTAQQELEGQDEAGDDEALDGDAGEDYATDEGTQDLFAEEAHDDSEADGFTDELEGEDTEPTPRWAHESDKETRDEAGDDEFELAFEDRDASEFEFDEEAYAEQAEQAIEEEEAGDRTPLPVPADHPVPFAPLPPAGSHWPVRTRHKSARLVSYMYQAPSGIVGSAGRMFLAARKGVVSGRTVGRWHCGLDLYASRNDVVVACEAGTIVGFSHFYKARSGQSTYKLLVEHDGSGIVLNYGEVRSDSLSRNGLKVGSPVAAGQTIGFVSDTDMLHVEAYQKGTTDSHRWWKSEPTPPRELLNPTRYLLALARSGLADAATPAAPAHTGGKATTGSPVKPAAELVRFAQRVLNAAEGERLGDDGGLGPLTRAALARFRQKYGIGASSLPLEERTLTGLMQRALEELRQQSMFAQTGVLDDRTRSELSAFRAQRGLGTDARLDAATRLALTDALARARAPAPRSPATPRTPATPTAPTAPTAPLPGLPGLGAGHAPPADPSAYRRFRLTTYHVVDQHDEPTGTVRVPILDEQGQVLAHCSPSFFAKLSLEGSGRLTDGRLVNVTGRKVAATHADYEPVLAHHRKAYAKGDAKRAQQGRPPAPTAYSGIIVSGGRVVQALSFHEVPAAKRGVGYGTARNIPYTPFRTLAADIGTPQYGKVEPRWKGKGGLVPPGTHVFIKEYVGLRLPDGSTHDGWFVVNDTGGAIFGAHFDVFTGTDALRQGLKLPAFGQVWFPGIDQRIPAGYTYGLEK
jgi:peptidoglycan hydrolase-like protein with peptidoglycan-binding domain